MDGVGEKEKPTGKAEEPENIGNVTLFSSFRGNPLKKKPHKKEPLSKEPQY